MILAFFARPGLEVIISVYNFIRGQCIILLKHCLLDISLAIRPRFLPHEKNSLDICIFRNEDSSDAIALCVPPTEYSWPFGVSLCGFHIPSYN
jgi:hypothetical protein